MLFLGSVSALCTLLFAAPAAPLGLPWNTVVGHIVSISIAVGIHWIELLFRVNLWAVVLAPSLAIGAMSALKVVNPPAAAAATICAINPLARQQPLWGAFFILCPALIGVVWALLVQFGLAFAVHAIKGVTTDVRPDPVVTVRCVNHDTASTIAQAVEGAAYVDDPLLYIIDTLTEERNRTLQVHRLFLGFMKKKRRASQETEECKVIRLQQAARRMLLLRKAAMKFSVSGPTQGQSGGAKAASSASPDGNAAATVLKGAAPSRGQPRAARAAPSAPSAHVKELV